MLARYVIIRSQTDFPENWRFAGCVNICLGNKYFI
jgi:hypothetical protein